MTADRDNEPNKRLLDRYNKMFHVNVKDHQDMSGILFCPLFDRAGDIGSLSVFRLLRPITQLKNTQSDLISGSLNRAISTNGSAYEFPTDDAWARILMRKHRTPMAADRQGHRGRGSASLCPCLGTRTRDRARARLRQYLSCIFERWPSDADAMR